MNDRCKAPKSPKFTGIHGSSRKSTIVVTFQHSFTAIGATCMQCRRIISEKHRYRNIKGCGDAARFFADNWLLFREKPCGDFCWKCGTNVPPANANKERGCFHAKTQN